MQEKRLNKNCKIRKVCIIGVIPSFAFQRAKFCALELHRKLPARFPPPEIVGLLELDWNEKLTEWKQTFGRDYWCLRRPVAVFFDNKFIGSDIDLIKMATLGNVLFENIPRENMSFLKENFKNDYISYLRRTKRIYCYLDICVDGAYVGTLNFELFSDLVPKTCENFKTLCLGSKGPLFSYRGSRIHRIVKDGWVQGGDIQYKVGGGGYSIFCDPLEDECLGISHDRRGVLSMANCGRNSNGSQFFITLKPSPWMDSRFVAFGQLIEGSHVLKLIESFETSYECPLKVIEIKSCGKLDLGDEEVVSEKEEKEDILKRKPKKIEKISEQILQMIVEALTSALEKKEHRIDILDDGDVPSKMNLQLYFLGLYSLPADILVKSAEYLRTFRRRLLRVAKPSATEIVEVLVYDLMVACLTRMTNLDDIRETLGHELYNKMLSKVEMQMELCQKPYVKKFVDQVVSTAESMVDLVTKKLMFMKKKLTNIKVFHDKMDNWIQSFVLQEVFKGDCYYIADRPSWNKYFKKPAAEVKKEKELTARGGKKCCEEEKKRKEKEIMEKMRKKYNPADFCCLGKKIFDEVSEINLYDFFSTCRYDLKKLNQDDTPRMPLLDLIEFSRCKLKCMRKQENRMRSSGRTCLERKIRHWMNEVVYTPETMWIRNLVFGKDDLVFDHMEEILYGAMTLGLLEMYYFYEQYLKLCGGKKKKVVIRTIFPDENNDGQKGGEDEVKGENDLEKDDEGDVEKFERRESRKKSEDTREESVEEPPPALPECTCGHPCCVCAFDPNAVQDGVPLQGMELELKPGGPRKLKKKKIKVCPPDTEMVDLKAIMAESTSLKADEIDVRSFRWLKSFILEKGCDLTSEFATQVHKWLDGERFDFKNFISKHSLVTRASLLSLSLSLAELIMEENKLKKEIVNFIYDLWELYFNEMFKEALIQYPPEEVSGVEEEGEYAGGMANSRGDFLRGIRGLRGSKEKLVNELEGEDGDKKDFDIDKDMPDACKKIIAETPDFDIEAYCKALKNEENKSDDDELQNIEEQEVSRVAVTASSSVNVKQILSDSLQQEVTKTKETGKIVSDAEIGVRENISEVSKFSKVSKVSRASTVSKVTSIKGERLSEENKSKSIALSEEGISAGESEENLIDEGRSETHVKKRRKSSKKVSVEQQGSSISHVKNANDSSKRSVRSEKVKDHIGSLIDLESKLSEDMQTESERVEKKKKVGKRRRKSAVRPDPIIIEEIVSDHSDSEDSRRMPPYVLPFWIKFLTQLTKQALGTIAQISRLPRRIYFSQDEENDFEDRVKDWIEFNSFNPQPTKGREIMDFIALHHKSLTSLEESARSYLQKKKFSSALSKCTRMRSAEVIADDILAAIVEAAMHRRKESETVELYISKVMSSAITSIQRDSEVTVEEKYSLKSDIETNAKESPSYSKSATVEE